MNKQTIVIRNTDGQVPSGQASSHLQGEEQIRSLLANPINNPTPKYLATTSKIDISNLTFGDTYTSITDGYLTVSFSTPVEKLGPVPSGWSTWS